MEDVDDNLPLHLAISSQTALDGKVIIALLLAYPEAAKRKDLNDFLPLDLFAGNHRGEHALLVVAAAVLLAAPTRSGAGDVQLF